MVMMASALGDTAESADHLGDAVSQAGAQMHLGLMHRIHAPQDVPTPMSDKDKMDELQSKLQSLNALTVGVIVLFLSSCTKGRICWKSKLRSLIC